MPLALRSPRFLPHSLTAFLFENHYAWWLPILALAIILIFLARSRANQKLLRAGQLLLALTLLWIIAAQLIATPAERLYNAHLALADAVARADVDRILSYFDSTFAVDARPVQILDTTTPAQAKGIIAAALKTYAIRDFSYRYYAATLYPDATARSNFTALTTGDYPLLTSWQVSWDDLPGQDWRITQAKLLKIGDQPVSPDLFNSPSPHLP